MELPIRMHEIPKEWKSISNFHIKLQISFLQLLFSYYILKVTHLKSLSLSCLVITSSATELRKTDFLKPTTGNEHSVIYTFAEVTKPILFMRYV